MPLLQLKLNGESPPEFIFMVNTPSDKPLQLIGFETVNESFILLGINRVWVMITESQPQYPLSILTESPTKSGLQLVF